VLNFALEKVSKEQEKQKQIIQTKIQQPAISKYSEGICDNQRAHLYIRIMRIRLHLNKALNTFILH
jgi:hypothetical protein